MRKMLLSVSLATLNLLYGQNFAPVQSQTEVQEELNFLTDTTDQVGFTYLGSVGALNGLNLPLSYYSTADYWGKYVGSIAGNNLHVVDVYNPGDYTLVPQAGSPGADLQVERVNVYSGTDIYDAACWQIALGVCGKAGMSGSSGGDLFSLAQNEDLLLQVGYDGNAPQVQPNANRAVTRTDGTFSYNGQSIKDGSQAYFFRMVTRNWLSNDPFIGTSYMQYITANNLPPNPEYQAGKITWLDWKPITGENAWAFFIGPLQAASLKQQASKGQYVPFSSTAVQNAMGALFALRCMQSGIGGIYYACKGSLGNQGSQPVNPYEVSVENNASALAGLMIFKAILEDELIFETDLTTDQKTQIQTALNGIHSAINGGQTPQGNPTEGLVAFFKKYAWDAKAGIFYQGGDANNPHLGSDWVPTSEPKAVDVSTWGVSVLGQPLIDSWFGTGTSFQIWQKVKSWGGFYGPDQTLWGVGYSNRDGNGKGVDYKKGIISAEWTAGAINMLRCLITQYQATTFSGPHAKLMAIASNQYVASLQKDHDSMYKNLMSLRSDQYPTADAYSSVRPDGYASLLPIPSDKLAFVYASKRYMIPFGWFANPLPSTTSTSWALMLHYNFNPFKAGGDYTAYSW